MVGSLCGSSLVGLDILEGELIKKNTFLRICTRERERFQDSKKCEKLKTHGSDNVIKRPQGNVSGPVLAVFGGFSFTTKLMPHFP